MYLNPPRTAPVAQTAMTGFGFRVYAITITDEDSPSSDPVMQDDNALDVTDGVDADLVSDPLC